MKYKIYSERNLLVDILDDDVTLADLEKLFLHEIQNENFKFVNKVLSNVNNANFKISLDEMENFIKFMITPNPDSSFRWAILTKLPIQTVFSFIIKEHEYFKDMVEVFSTLEACNKFLNISFDNEEFYDNDYLNID